MKSKNSGVVLVLLVPLLFVFIAFCALVIGIGVIATNRSRVQNIANAAALAALDRWVTESQTQPLAENKIGPAKTRADELLAMNFVSNLQNPSGGIGTLQYDWDTADPNAAGIITYGVFYPRNPGSDPCGTILANYPCFVGYNQLAQIQANPTVNAVRVTLNTRSTNPVVAPFADFLQSSLFQIPGVATATLVERCTAFLLDLSMSSMIETHDFADPRAFWAGDHGIPYQYSIANMQYPGLFAVRDAEIKSQTECVTSPPPYLGPESKGWCNMRPQRGSPPGSLPPAPWDNPPVISPPSPNPTDPEWISYSNWIDDAPWFSGSLPTPQTFPSDCPDGPFCANYKKFHYRDDFLFGPVETVSAQSYNTTVRVDKYVDRYYSGPEPLMTFLLAFNAGLRTLAQQQTAFDKASVRAFTGREVARIPPVFGAPPSPPPPTFTSDLGYLIQVTNADNRGTFSRDDAGVICQDGIPNSHSDCRRTRPRISPNFVSHGLFPLYKGGAAPYTEDGHTNLVEILDSTMNDMVADCPANAKKQIIIATDGVASCTYNTAEAIHSCAPSIVGSYPYYLNSERQLIGMQGTNISSPVDTSSNPYPSILQRAINSEIAISVLMAGSGVEPNIRDIQDATPAETGDFLSYAEAQSLGFGTLGYEPPSCHPSYTGTCNVTEHRSSCQGEADCDVAAFENFGQPGYVFRRPNGTLARLAMFSGGLWCPLMKTNPNPACYNSEGELTCRNPDQIQTFSLFNQPQSQLAAVCASQAVGSNPYMLAEPLCFCYLGNCTSCI